MSWAEVKKINSNLNLALNEQARELAYVGLYLFTSNTVFTPDKSGWYKIIVVGKGGESRTGATNNPTRDVGASSGVVVAVRNLSSLGSYTIGVNNSDSSFTYNADDVMTAGAGGDYNTGVGGTASGGDFRYRGVDGCRYSAAGDAYVGHDTGVFIPGLSARCSGICSSLDYGTAFVESGYGILGFGASAGVSLYPTGTGPHKSTGCVIVIPLELEE